MKTKFNFAQFNDDDKNDIIKLLVNKGELTLKDIKVILGLKPWATNEDVVNEIRQLI